MLQTQHVKNKTHYLSTIQTICLSSFLHFFEVYNEIYLKYKYKYKRIFSKLLLEEKHMLVFYVVYILGEKQIESNILCEMMDLYFLNFFTKNKALRFSHVIFSSTKIESDICLP